MISDISVDADCCWCLPEEGAGGGHDDPVGEVAAALLRDQHRVRGGRGQRGIHRCFPMIYRLALLTVVYDRHQLSIFHSLEYSIWFSLMHLLHPHTLLL